MHSCLAHWICRAIASEREFMVFDMVLVAAATFLAIGAVAAWISVVGPHAKSERDRYPVCNQAGGNAALSSFRVAPADMVKALLDCGEARFDHRLKFEVGEDIWPVLFDAFADEFTDIN